MLSNVEDGKLTHVIAKYHSLSDSDDKGVEGPAFNAHFIKFAAVLMHCSHMEWGPKFFKMGSKWGPHFE